VAGRRLVGGEPLAAVLRPQPGDTALTVTTSRAGLVPVMSLVERADMEALVRSQPRRIGR